MERIILQFLSMRNHQNASNIISRTAASAEDAIGPASAEFGRDG